jgi:hypothetical protein
MKKQDYHTSISANVSAEEAFEAINNVSAWWAKNFDGFSQSLHDIFTVRFGETFVTFEITEFVPGKRVVWQVTDCYLHWINDKTEWNGTSILWEVTPEGDGVRVDMTHRGLVPDAECFEDCQTGWNHHIGESLLKYLNESVGMPA